jgi:mono/diheme cytochrome c family protein
LRIVRILAAIVLIGAVAAAAAIYWGVYDVAATDQHLAPTYWLLKAGMRRSIIERAKDIEEPTLSDDALVRRGVGLYREHCLRCHGAPGIAPEPFALGMTPVPENLLPAAKTWRAAEIFWAAKKGIKMTGMPAWEYRLSDEELWAIVAFVKQLPALTPAQYRALKPLSSKASAAADAPQPDPRRGTHAINQYACVTCHVIPGIVGASQPVGPSLEKIASRSLIAGMLPNRFENMVRWLQAPQKLKPGSAMPDLGLSERDARDIAAYLETLN